MISEELLDHVAPEAVRDTTGMEKAPHAGVEWVRSFSLVNLARAEAHYEGLGYIQRAVPWIVSDAAYCSTKPDGVLSYETIGGYLVGSAEQAFLQLLLQGEELGRHQALTPCFRNEVHDEQHLPYFMKLELFDGIDVNRNGLERMVEAALSYYSPLLPVEVVAVENGALDIVSREGIELGSYGIRTMRFEGRDLSWVYGTGCAEPRLTQAVEASHR